LYVMNPDGSDQRRLDDELVYHNAFAWETISPDRKWRLEVRDIHGNVDIWRVDVAGNPPDYQITSNAAIDQEPVWAPIDQNHIAFVSDRMGSTDIWTQNVSEPLDEKQLTDNPDYDKHPSWSPDGKQIVYWAVHQGGPRQIWVVNAESKEKWNISNNDYNDWDPIWIKRP
jgi:TolB protein